MKPRNVIAIAHKEVRHLIRDARSLALAHRRHGTASAARAADPLRIPDRVTRRPCRRCFAGRNELPVSSVIAATGP